MCAPSQLRARAWSQSAAELPRSPALPLSFVLAPLFRRFRAQVDHRYRLPSPAFFSREALPLLHGAMGKQVRQGMQWAEGGRVHLTVSVAARVADVDHTAVTAHCGVTQLRGRQVASGSPRRQAMPGSDACPWTGLRRRAAGAVGAAQPLWLGHSAAPGLPGVGRLPESGSGREDGGLHPHPPLRPLPRLPGGKLLCHQHSVQIMLGTAGASCSHFQGSAEARRLLPAAAAVRPPGPPALLGALASLGVRLPLAGVAGETAAGEGRGSPVGRVAEPDGQSGQAPAALLDGGPGGERRAGRLELGAGPSCATCASSWRRFAGALRSGAPGRWARPCRWPRAWPCSSPQTTSSLSSSTVRSWCWRPCWTPLQGQDRGCPPRGGRHQPLEASSRVRGEGARGV